MSYCYVCGCEIPEGHKFCSQCGTCVQSYCTACGNKLEPGHKFCSQCGASVSTQNNGAVTSGNCRKYSLKYSILGFVFGITAFYFSICCFVPIAGLFVFLPMFITFTVLSKTFANKHVRLGYPRNGFIKASVILSNLAIGFGAFCAVGGFGMTISLFTVE